MTTHSPAGRGTALGRWERRVGARPLPRAGDAEGAPRSFLGFTVGALPLGLFRGALPVMLQAKGSAHSWPSAGGGGEEGGPWEIPPPPSSSPSCSCPPAGRLRPRGLPWPRGRPLPPLFAPLARLLAAPTHQLGTDPLGGRGLSWSGGRPLPVPPPPTCSCPSTGC